MSNAKELLTADELAIRLRVRANTVRNWARHGVIPKVRFSRKVIRYDFHAVVEAMRRRHMAEGGGDV